MAFAACIIPQAHPSANTCKDSLNRKELAQAMVCLEDSLARDPGQGAVEYQLGLVYRDMGNPRKAATHFQAAIDRGFRNLGVTFNLSSAYFASRQSALGFELAQRITSAAPKSPDLLLRLGQLLFRHLYYREALRAFQMASEQAPDESEPRFYLALTHFLLSQFAETITVLSAGVDTFTNPEAVNLLAASHAGLGNLVRASELLQEMIDKAPGSPHAYLNLSLIRFEQGRLEEARTLLDDFRSLGPQRDAKLFYVVKRNSCSELAAEIRANSGVQPATQKADFYFNMASQLQDRYHHSSAVEVLRLARQYEGNSGRLLQAAGMNCLNLAPQAPEAIWLLGQAVVKDPERHEGWYLLGRAHMRQAAFEEALAAFRHAMALQPRAIYAVNLGKALLSAKALDEEHRQREVLAAFEQAVALEPNDAVSHFELGRWLSQSKRFDEARSHLLKAVDLEPDFYEAYYVLSRLLSRSGDREHSQKYLALFEHTKQAVMQQSIVGSTYISEGQSH